MNFLNIELRPHIEDGGYPRDRFEAWLGDQLLTVHRSGWHVPARKLLELGYPPETLMRVQHAGKPFDPTIVPQTVGHYAERMVYERDKTGLSNEKWSPMPRDGVKDGREGLSGPILPETLRSRPSADVSGCAA